jgi:hypothetical protein
MRDRSWFASCHAGRRLLTITWLARSTTVPDLLALLVLYKSHWFFSENINLIRSYFKDLRRADFSTLATSITLICINGDIPVAGPILKSIVGNHCIYLSFPPHPIPLPPGERGLKSLGFSCTLCLSHLQQRLSEQGCSDGSGKLSVKGITAINILLLVPDTVCGLDP